MRRSPPRRAAALALGLLLVASAVAQPPARLTDDEAFRRLRGTWSPVTLVTDGAAGNAADYANVRFIFRGDRWSLEKDGEILEAGKMRYEKEWSGSGLAIDLVATTGARKGQVIPAIFSADKERLHYASRNPGGDRPTKFRSTPGDKVTYQVWKRTPPPR